MLPFPSTPCRKYVVIRIKITNRAYLSRICTRATIHRNIFYIKCAAVEFYHNSASSASSSTPKSTGSSPIASARTKQSVSLQNICNYIYSSSRASSSAIFLINPATTASRIYVSIYCNPVSSYPNSSASCPARSRARATATSWNRRIKRAIIKRNRITPACSPITPSDSATASARSGILTISRTTR